MKRAGLVERMPQTFSFPVSWEEVHWFIRFQVRSRAPYKKQPPLLSAEKAAWINPWMPVLSPHWTSLISLSQMFVTVCNHRSQLYQGVMGLAPLRHAVSGKCFALFWRMSASERLYEAHRASLRFRGESLLFPWCIFRFHVGEKTQGLRHICTVTISPRCAFKALVPRAV